jgi:hypothetical protein
MRSGICWSKRDWTLGGSLPGQKREYETNENNETNEKVSNLFVCFVIFVCFVFSLLFANGQLIPDGEDAGDAVRSDIGKIGIILVIDYALQRHIAVLNDNVD